MIRAGLAIAGLVALVATAAEAQTAPAAAPRAVTMPASGRVRVSVGWDGVLHTGSDTVVAISAGFGPTAYPLTFVSWSNVLTGSVDTGDALFRAVVPQTYLVIDGPPVSPVGGDQAELGNVELEGLANVDVGAEHRLLVGGGVALPTATDQGRGAQFRLVAWETSFRDAPLWVDQALTVWPTLDYRFAIPWLWVSALVTVPVFFPLARDGGPQPLSRGRVEVMVEVDAAAALRILDTVDVGVAFLAWTLPTGADRDPRSPPWIDLAQTALTLSVRSDPLLDAPVFGGAEMIFDLDGRWGPTGAPGKLWGLHAFFGGRLDL